LRVFIREYCRDVTIRIYGLDGEERTREFFDKYFSYVRDVGKMSDEARAENLSEAEYYIATAEEFEYFAQKVGYIQTAIDLAAVAQIYGRNEYIEDEENCLI